MPAATPTELGSYLGMTIDSPRAQVLLNMARALIVGETGIAAEDWPDPLWAVHLACAARGYTNPAEKTQETTGSRSYSVSATGIFLMDRERRICAQIAGRGDLSSVTLERRYCP